MAGRTVGRRWAMWLAAAVVAGCGGGGGSGDPGSDSCDVASQNAWMRDYMNDRYFWAGKSPNPDPSGYGSVESYFEALLFPGDGVDSADRWSYITDSESYNRFFGDGKTLGYGVFVNGLEATLPLKLRYVEPLSPAAAAGLRRGDEIVSINGRPAAEVVAADDYTMLSPTAEGERLTFELRQGGVPRTVQLSAAIYALVPVPVSTVFTLPSGVKAGYLLLKDFVTQAEAPLAAAIADIRQQGATELILDLRYNGGGRVSTANVLASLVAGATNNGKVFTQLRYNAKNAASNTEFVLANGGGAAFSRVIVLTGARTCSASEMLVNGLTPHVQVVTLGGTTCGKPYGFNPVQSCGSTFSAVNFETVNALGEGRYVDGIAANCSVADDFSGELGDPAEKLAAAAQGYLSSGVCPAVSEGRTSGWGARRGMRAVPVERLDRRVQ
ncbi:MAG TPA: S41 family peptidase [Albitalea sp.]